MENPHHAFNMLYTTRGGIRAGFNISFHFYRATSVRVQITINTQHTVLCSPENILNALPLFYARRRPRDNGGEYGAPTKKKNNECYSASAHDARA